jgi:hypothetical protein
MSIAKWEKCCEMLAICLSKRALNLIEYYGKSKGLGTKVARITKLMDELRSKLEDKLFEENPDLEINDGCKYYY